MGATAIRHITDIIRSHTAALTLPLSRCRSHVAALTPPLSRRRCHSATLTLSRRHRTTAHPADGVTDGVTSAGSRRRPRAALPPSAPSG
eukprot:2504888-Prymnesium_polylepis.1